MYARLILFKRVFLLNYIDIRLTLYYPIIFIYFTELEIGKQRFRIAVYNNLRHKSKIRRYVPLSKAKHRMNLAENLYCRKRETKVNERHITIDSNFKSSS